MRALLCGLVLGFPLVANAVPGSGHCPTSSGSKALRSGTHDGKFFHMTTFAGGPAQQGLSLQLHFRGRLHVEVDAKGDVSAANAELTYWLGGAGEVAKVLVTSLNAKATGTLTRVGATATSFTATGRVSGAQQSNAGTREGAGTGRGAIDEVVTVTFTIESADCDRVRGTFASDTIDTTIAGLAAKGFTAQRGESDWHLGEKGSSSAELAYWKGRVQQAIQYKGPLERRRVAQQKLEEVFADMKDRHGVSPAKGRDREDAIMECLWRLWLEGAKELHTGFIEEDAPALRTYAGDVAGLADKVGRMLRNDRAIVEAGIDTCGESVHRLAWGAIQAAMEKALQRAYERGEPVELMGLIERSTLLGAVSPGLNEKLWNRLRSLAADTRLVEFGNLKTTFADPARVCSPEVQSAMKRALVADRQYSLIGGTPGGEVPDFIAGQVAKATDQDRSACR